MLGITNGRKECVMGRFGDHGPESLGALIIGCCVAGWTNDQAAEWLGCWLGGCFPLFSPTISNAHVARHM